MLFIHAKMMIGIMKKALVLGYGVLSARKYHPLYARQVSTLTTTSAAMDPYGNWEVIDTNDTLVFRLKSPVIVNITPSGFSINKGIFGSFRVEPLTLHSKSGVYVSMCMFNLPLLKRVYLLEALEWNRIALFGTGALSSNYYILRRLHQTGCET